MTPNDIATDVTGLKPVGEGSINLPSYNHTWTFDRMDDTSQWDR